MFRKLLTLLSLLVVAAVFMAACGAPTPAAPATEEPAAEEPAAEEPADEEPAAEEPVAEEPAAEEPAQEDASGILARVQERGTLICGGRTDLAGFGSLDDDGNNVGFDIDLCRAVAAAVLGDANAIEIVPLTSADRGPVLQTAEVDLLSRNVTWTSSRDVQWGDFTTVMFYDGQGFMVSDASGITSTDDFADGISACVTSGTTTEQNLADYFRQRDIEFEPVIFEEAAAVYGAFQEGRCDVTTSDRSQLVSVRSGFDDPSAYTILDDIISKEPLTPAVPHGDTAWFDTVKLVMWSLINAEELGVTSANVEEMKNSENINVRRLLGVEGNYGYEELGLDADALANAIAAVGNYGEIYDRNLGPDATVTLPRGLNELWTEGGLIYAPPVK